MMNKFYDVDLVRDALHCPVPSITPMFHKDGEIDWNSSEKLVEMCIEGGAKSLLVTAGDSLLTILTDDETMKLNQFVAKVANGRAMVIAYSKFWCHKQMLEYAQACKAYGCDLVIPFYPDWAQSLSTEALTQCYREIGAIMPTMLLTNLCNGRGIPFAVLKELTPEDGIVALKDDAPAPYGKTALAITREKFAFMQGGRAINYMDLEPFGADGYLSVYARVFPDVSNRFWNAYHGGDIKKAVELVEQYDVAFFDMVASNGINFSAGIQALFEVAGIGQRWRRSPYSSVTDQQMEVVRDFCAAHNLV